MCGIAGILTHGEAADNLDRLLQKMQQSLQHRGPDDSGRFISRDRQGALAHTRLSILDLSSAGHQPMADEEGRYWIVFNGEIYNFQTLRDRLIAQGEQFQSRTDTEVILKLYRYYGADCVRHLRGMFAFAIWDDLKKECFLARDPFGIKPLYYWHHASTLVFASELKTILTTGLPPIHLSPMGLYGYFLAGSVPEPLTPIENISCLPAGHWLRWQSGQINSHCYWQIDFAPKAIAYTAAVEQTRSALLDSIQHHFVSDVPVGVFLSGGIDSTAVVALARQTHTGSLKTYSIAFEEPEWNEGAVAQKIAHTFGTDHVEYTITANLGRALFPQYLAALDCPSIDGFNTFCVARLARQNGMKVVLSGLGGDELFGGYASFRRVPQMVRLARVFQIAAPLRNALGVTLEATGPSLPLRRLGSWLQNPPGSGAAYRAVRGIFTPREARALVECYCPGQGQTLGKASPLSPVCPTLTDAVSWLELSLYMRNQLLRDSDTMSMNCGLELRVPLVDRVLLEAIATIPSSQRLASGKQLLVDAVPEIPQWVVKRPKQPFAFPFERWLSAEWQGILPEGGAGLPNLPDMTWYRRWSVGVFQHWWQQIKP